MENPLYTKNRLHNPGDIITGPNRHQPEEVREVHYPTFQVWKYIVDYYAKIKYNLNTENTASDNIEHTHDNIGDDLDDSVIETSTPFDHYNQDHHNSILDELDDSLIEIEQTQSTSSVLHDFLSKRLHNLNQVVVGKPQYGTDLSISFPQLSKSTYQNNYQVQASTPQTKFNAISEFDKLTSKNYTESVLKYYVPSEPINNLTAVDSLVSNFQINDDVSSKYFKNEKDLYEQIDKLRLGSLSKITPLTASQQAQLDQIWRSHSNSLVISNFQIEIMNNDLKTLQDGRWLNDNVIDYYLNLIMDSNTKVYAWTTHFFTTLETKGYQGVARWAKRRKLNVFEKDIIIIPINIMNTHWALAVVDNVEKKIEYLDSLSTSGNASAVKLLANYMAQEAKRLNVKEIDYKLLSNTKSPQQNNGSDCGVFTCSNARFKAERKDSSFTQSDMKTIRRRMAFEIMTKKLLT